MLTNEEELRRLFTLSYGDAPPNKKKWESLYSEDVIFIDPTQKKEGIDAYVNAQNQLIKRCDDVFLKPHAIAFTNNVAFVEWTMGLKIKGFEFIYEGTTRLRFNEYQKVVEHRDYFDFCSCTFANVPILGNFFRWLYSLFVD